MDWGTQCDLSRAIGWLDSCTVKIFREAYALRSDTDQHIASSAQVILDELVSLSKCIGNLRALRNAPRAALIETIPSEAEHA